MCRYLQQNKRCNGDLIWVSFESSFGCQSNVFWMSFGCPLDIVWMSFGCRLYIVWMSCGCLWDVAFGRDWNMSGRCWSHESDFVPVTPQMTYVTKWYDMHLGPHWITLSHVYVVCVSYIVIIWMRSNMLWWMCWCGDRCRFRGHVGGPDPPPGEEGEIRRNLKKSELNMSKLNRLPNQEFVIRERLWEWETH